MNNYIKLFLALSFSAFILQGCYYDKADKLYSVSSTSCDTSSVTYAAVIKPIIQLNCSISGCHDASQSGGYDYRTYDGLVIAILNGRLLGSINQQNGYSAMPKQGGKLSACDISKIRIWVNNGYPNN